MLIDRLIQWSRGEVAAPTKIHLQLTRACNLRCQSCWQPVDSFRSKERLTRDRLLQIVDQAAELGISEWNIIGGEPLARRETCKQLIDRIRRLDMNGELSTNGTLFTEELIVALVDAQWNHVRFSIDCPDAETHDLLRGKTGAFTASEWAMTTFNSYKQKTGSRFPRIEIMMVLSARNYTTLPRMVEYALSLGLDKLTVQPASILSEDGRELRLDPDTHPDILEYIHQAKQIADRAGLEHQLGDLYERRLLKDTDRMDETLESDIHELPKDFFAMFCFDPWFVMAIRPNGDIGPCDRFVDKFDDAGPRECDNVMEKDLAEIWTGPYFTKIRAMVAANEIPYYCRDCCVCKITHCRSLRAMAYRRMGNYEQAINVYARALRDNPHQDNYWLGIGSCYQELSQFNQAIPYHERVVALNPDQGWGWYGLGDSYLQLRRYQQAAESFERGLAIAYLEPHLKFLLLRGAGLSRLESGREAEAAQALEQALLIENQDEVRRLLERCTKA